MEYDFELTLTFRQPVYFAGFWASNPLPTITAFLLCDSQSSPAGCTFVGKIKIKIKRLVR